MIEGNKAKGDSFEKLALAYFRTDPKFQNIKNVWHQRDIPYDVRSHLGLPTNDIGIDILLESVDGEYYPVQCKFHSDPNRAVGWKEASTFIGILNSNENFKAGYLSSNAFEVSSNYDKAISGKPIVRLLGSIWDTVDPDPTAKTREALVPLKPRPHQEKAINDAIEYFVKEENSRGKLIFPCGAGKSLTGFWITQKLDAKSILVAVPSLALVKQTLEVYLREIAATQKNARWLCVCSDKEIGSADEVKIHTSDLGVPCTTDPTEICNWLKRPGDQQQIVFTTYQSGRLVADIAREENIAFDLAILDEAHKTVGSTGKLFSYLLFDQNIEIRKRIFMTATERFYSGSKDDIVSMDDLDVYGEVFTQMTFKEAINLDLLTDYKIITIDVAKKEIADFIRENKLVELNSKWGKETEARSLAAMIALRKAMKALPIRNAVSFHSSIAKAERNDKLQKHITEAYKLPAIASYTVSGKMSTGQRDRIVNEFASKKGALITNARCLTEGVDVPNIDCIVFADPRKSRIDIVQALGRALRRKEGKDWGYVILPVVYDGDTHEIDNDNFQEIVSIIRGLAANDERIVEYFKDKQSIEKTGGVQLTNVQLEFLTDILEESQFQSQLEIKLWENLSRFNWLPFEEARELIRSLGLKNTGDWKDYIRTEKFPLEIPKKPDQTYKNRGWISLGDWLGTGKIANKNRVFLPFEEAREIVRALGLRNWRQWGDYVKAREIEQLNIPSEPSVTYLNSGWIDFGDWLGTNSISTKKRQYKEYHEALKFSQNLNFSSTKEWFDYCESGKKPNDIPVLPYKTYKSEGWTYWGEWLGTMRLGNQSRVYLPFTEAREFVRQLKLSNEKEWKDFCVSGNKPDNIPAKPYRIYKHLGWIGLGDWLGTNRISNANKVFLPFEEARHFARQLKLNGVKEWRHFCNSDSKPDNIPTSPNQTYKNTGWIDFGDWLGTNRISNANKVFLPFEKARSIVHLLNLKNQKEWQEYAKSNNRIAEIPTSPQTKYQDRGWINWGDWLGTSRIDNSSVIFREFADAKNFAQSLNLSNVKEWNIWSKSEERSKDIPSNPQKSYKLSGWTNWPDFLGYDKKK